MASKKSAAPAVEIVAAAPVMESGAAAVKKGVSVAAAKIEETQTEVKATMDKTMKTAEDLMAFSQGNMEAFMKSSQIWAAGVQDLGKHVAATAQAQLDETMATMKALSGVKSLKEAMDLQASLSKGALEKIVAESGKLTDASMKLAEQTMAPITARVTLAAEKFGKTV